MGITTALKVKVDKKGKNPGHGKIVGGKRKGGEAEGRFGAMSEVVVLRGMVDGLDLGVELGPDGTLVQEIGEECGEKVRLCLFAAVDGPLLTVDSTGGSSGCLFQGTRLGRACRSLYTSRVRCRR